MGGNGPGKIDDLSYGQKLEGMSEVNQRRGGQLFKETQPLYNEQVGQTLEALRTGGVGAQIPVIQRAVEQSKAGASSAMAGTESQLRGAGLSGTPFGQGIMSNQRMQGAQATSQIPTNIAQGFINNAGNVSGQGFTAGGNYSNLGAQTLGNLQSVDLSRQIQNAQQFQHFMNSLASMSSQASSSACLHPDTFIETPIGDRMVRFLHVGDRVVTMDAAGEKVDGRIRAITTKPVSMAHKMATVSCPRGEAIITPAHPLPDGTPVDDGVLATAGRTDHTMDLLVDGPTGVYFVLGLALGSTLDSRHAAARKVA